jgi:radical SAM superfamily enzyme YgiQ (UPF0313 family)
MRVLLVSTYALGHQPLQLASAGAALRAAGHEPRCIDLAVEAWSDEEAAWAEAVAFSVPMHTAMRLAVRAATGLRRSRPDVPVCLFGLYAAVSAETTIGAVADRVIAGEFEPALVAWVDELAAGAIGTGSSPVRIELGRRAARLPARDLLPPLERYTRLALGSETRLVGALDATRGCAHRCRHCPVPVVYDGRVRPVDEEAVVADAAQLVALGARHLSFGDPDFLNAPRHAMRAVTAVHAAFPELTFDCTVKVEHVLRYRDLWPTLAAFGCLFVVSALESVDDATLERLDKGHTAADGSEAIRLLRGHGIELRPSFLPFTPWTTPADVARLLDFVAGHDLIPNVDPVQYTIRLLLPEGSLLLDHPDVASRIIGYDAERLSFTWTSADPRADALQADLAGLVSSALAAGESSEAIFLDINAVTRSLAGVPQFDGLVTVPSEERARLTEPWFCCAEPTEDQFGSLRCLADPSANAGLSATLAHQEGE